MIILSINGRRLDTEPAIRDVMLVGDGTLDLMVVTESERQEQSITVPLERVEVEHSTEQPGKSWRPPRHQIH